MARFGCGAHLLVAAGLLAAGNWPCLAQGSDATPFTLSTLNFNSGGTLPMAQVNSAHGCKGGNSPPAMQWSAPPQGTKSFAVTFFDVTARKGEGFWHWALFDIPPNTRKIDLNQTPPGAKTGRNDFGDAGYGGACPPPGETHQYKLTVWALRDASLPFDSGSSDKEIGAYIKAHAIAGADLMTSYKR